MIRLEAVRVCDGMRGSRRSEDATTVEASRRVSQGYFLDFPYLTVVFAPSLAPLFPVVLTIFRSSLTPARVWLELLM